MHSMRPFIAYHSVVRRIWGDPDVVLLIFAGAAAEFALNRAVDWLFFTSRLPKDPIGRLFSTVHYAQRIVFANERDALETLEKISAIHADGRLYVQSEDGWMNLLEAGDTQFTSKGRFQFADANAKRDAWAHPVIQQGRLYLRYHDKLSAFDIRAE